MLRVDHNIEQVEKKIQEACLRSGRRREDIELIAVTKYTSLPTVEQLIQQGIRHIGENRWPDARTKWEAFQQQAKWHFIGHLQANKVKDIVGKFSYVHSLDRLSLANALQRKAAELNEIVNCFIQVNISGEQTKHGLPPQQLFSFIESVRENSNLRLIGLMTMAPYEANPEDTRPVFRQLREWRDRLNDSGLLSYEVEHLSMGMSNDFEVAVEEGATWLRLGSILVGGD